MLARPGRSLRIAEALLEEALTNVRDALHPADRSSMADLTTKSLDALATWLRGELDDQARLNQLHTSTCNVMLGSISGNLNDQCDCAGPEFVLADVDAKRQILNGPLTGSGPDQYGEWEWTIRLLAAPFATRPGYRKEWAL